MCRPRAEPFEIIEAGEGSARHFALAGHLGGDLDEPPPEYWETEDVTHALRLGPLQPPPSDAAADALVRAKPATRKGAPPRH